MALIIRIFIGLCLGVLTSCTVSLSPKRQLEYLNATPNLEHAITNNLKQKAVFVAGNWPQKQWWLDYKAPELNALIAEALARNPTLLEMQARIHKARQDAIVIHSDLFPLVFFDATETNLYVSKNGLYRAFNPKFPLHATLLDLSLSFSYEFDFWGKNRNLFCEAVGKAKAQEAETAEVALIVTTALSQTYFAYKTNLIRKRLYTQLLQLRQSNANLQNVLLRKGLSSKIPALAASEDVFEAKKLLASIDEELSNNIYYINILAGRGPDTPLEINHHLPPLPKSLAIPSAISSDLLARRPDLMAQIWRAKAWAYRTGAAMSAYYPDVNITALLGLESTAWRKLFEISSGTAAIKPAINLPIFTAGAIRANIRANKAEFDAAIFAYNNLLLQSTQELLEVLVFAQTIYQQKKEQNKIVYSAEQRYSLINLLQRKGLNSQFDIYGLKEEVIQKKLVDVTLLYNQYLASIKLTKALGGGYYQPLVPLVKKYDKNPEK